MHMQSGVAYAFNSKCSHKTTELSAKNNLSLEISHAVHGLQRRERQRERDRERERFPVVVTAVPILLASIRVCIVIGDTLNHKIILIITF